ncbi:hypothetical protein K443DRAFT_677337 [Laccaria amethystina LaAM-08-1]|uniref:Uncharacterized protein n=1 Tax=Laccaria amethystina LaAM-08-1 TaxID=1095629 RepID=A0A0C9XMI8_9AGAR|nr:hypothetical protein K443DRAFT_677337 [Laccaria amethystina LaAM-08-1]
MYSPPSHASISFQIQRKYAFRIFLQPTELFVDNTLYLINGPISPPSSHAQS